MKLYRIILLYIFLITPLLAQEQDWEIVGTMPRPVADAEIIARNGLIHVLGGYRDSLGYIIPTDEIQTYDPVQNVWLPSAQMKTPRAGFVAGDWNDMLIYAGGAGLGIPIPPNIFSIETWNYLDPPNIYNYHPECNRLLTAGAVSGDNLYLIGGLAINVGDTLPIPYITEYHIPSATVTYRLDSLFNQSLLPYDQTVVQVDTDLYIFGGNWFVTRSEVHRFNTINHGYTQVFDMPRERAGVSATLMGERDIYLIGGYTETEPAVDSVSIFHANPAGYRMSSGPSMNFARFSAMSVKLDDYIYVFGGVGSFGQIVPQIERYAAITGIADGLEAGVVAEFQLKKNYPNPFNGQTLIPFELNRGMSVTLQVFSTTGEKIVTLLEGYKNAGQHEIQWDGRNENGIVVGSGIYFYKLQGNRQVNYEKMILVK
ncbi:MAG: T9SS type A sorting domain-containing protein [Calditrichia bacterium]